LNWAYLLDTFLYRVYLSTAQNIVQLFVESENATQLATCSCWQSIESTQKSRRVAAIENYVYVYVYFCGKAVVECAVGGGNAERLKGVAGWWIRAAAKQWTQFKVFFFLLSTLVLIFQFIKLILNLCNWKLTSFQNLYFIFKF